MPSSRPDDHAAQSVAFVKAARQGKLSLSEIAGRSGMSLDAAREVLFRGVQAKRLRINDADRQNIFIEVL